MYKTTVIRYHLECTGEGHIAIPVWETESNLFSALHSILICTRAYKLIKNKCKKSGVVSFLSLLKPSALKRVFCHDNISQGREEQP